MTQLALQMLTAYEGPRLVAPDELAGCDTYRDAVKRCYELRRRTSMTDRQLAEECECYASHLSQYLRDGKHQRDLPPGRIAAFEVACGNRAITQWLTAKAQLTILETFIQRRAA